MDGRGRVARRVAWIAVVLAVGCGSSNAPGHADATEAGADADGPTGDVDSFVCAQPPGCGLLSLDRVADCTYALSVAPEEPTNVGVYLVGDGGNLKIPRDSRDQDGWDYVDGTSMSIRLFGSWCDDDRSGMLGRPMLVAGCPGICIP
jgi:hypothetical protein